MRKRKNIVAFILAATLAVPLTEPVTASAGTLTADTPEIVSIIEMLNMSKDEDGAFGTKRLFVKSTRLDRYFGADQMTISGNTTLLQFESTKETKNAYQQLSRLGYDVFTDSDILSTADAASYTYDPIGQYNQTVTHVEAAGNIPVTLAPELNGLSQACREVVDAQGRTSVSNIGVAVIDSGLDTSNNVFSGRVMPGYNVITGGTSVVDDYGHGTFVSSIIANNTPSNVSIMPVKVVDADGSFSASRLMAGLAYIAEHSAGINVVNISLSINTEDSTQMDTISSAIDAYISQLYEKGIVVVTSGGNTESGARSADQSYPGNNSKTIAVSALSYKDGDGSWGSYSKTLSGNCIDFCAPGYNVRGVEASNIRMKEICAANDWKGEYLSFGDGTCVMNGSSAATPFVTAAAAILKSYDTSLSVADTKSLLQKNASMSMLSGTDSASYGYGYPEMSGYVYASGSKNTDGTVSGVVDGFDVDVNTSSGQIILRKYTGQSGFADIPATMEHNGKTYEVVIGRSTVSNGPFNNNSALQSVRFLNPAVTVENGDAGYMFYNCPNLKSVNLIPGNATNIKGMFHNDSCLTAIPDIPASVTNMTDTFRECSSLNGAVTITSGVVSAAKDIFTGITKPLSISVPKKSVTETTLLTELLASKNANVTVNGNTYKTLLEANELKNKKIEGFTAVWDDAAKTVTLSKYEGASSSLIVPATYSVNGVIYNVVIGKSTAVAGPFNNNSKLTSVAIANGVKVQDSDARYMFYNCPNLKSVSGIPSNATDISYICYNDAGLEKLPDIPASVTKMDYAFYGCSKCLTSTQDIIAKNITSATGAYDGVANVTVNIPKNSVTYETLSALFSNWASITFKTDGASTSADVLKAYTVKFHYRNKNINASGSTTTQNVKYGNVAAKPANKAVKNYVFVGWYDKNGDKYSFSNPVTNNIDLYAKWVYKKVGTPKIKSVTSQSKMHFTIKTNKTSNTTGYQIKYSRHKNFQNSGSAWTKNTTTKVETLNSGRYYVKVRAYKTINGKKYYGKWSKIKVFYVKK